MGAVVGALEDVGQSREARSALVAALVKQHRESGHSLWQAFLLLAFEPLLRKLRSRLGGDDADDLDQEVLLAFLEAVRGLHPTAIGPYVVHTLQRATKKALFAGRSAPVVHLDLDDDLHGAPPAVDLHSHLGEVVDAASAELRPALVAVYQSGETLQEFVTRAYRAETPAERVRTYLRLRTERERVFARIREAAA